MATADSVALIPGFFSIASLNLYPWVQRLLSSFVWSVLLTTWRGGKNIFTKKNKPIYWQRGSHRKWTKRHRKCFDVSCLCSTVHWSLMTVHEVINAPLFTLCVCFLFVRRAWMDCVTIVSHQKRSPTDTLTTSLWATLEQDWSPLWQACVCEDCVQTLFFSGPQWTDYQSQRSHQRQRITQIPPGNYIHILLSFHRLTINLKKYLVYVK